VSVESLLTTTLHERVESATYPPIRYWDVVDRAAAIRARRRHRVLAVAAAAAVVVPVGIAGASLRHALDDAPASPQPTHTPSHAPTRHPHPRRPAHPTFAEIRRGPAPRVAYLAGDTVVEPDGTRHALPQGSDLGADWAVPLGGGYLIHSDREVATDSSDRVFATLRRVEGSTVTSLGCGSNYVGVDRGRTDIAYWVAARCPGYGSDGALDVASVATGQVTTYLTSTRLVGTLDPVGIVAGRVIAEADRRDTTRVVSVGADGSVRTVPGLTSAFSFDPVHQLVAGQGPDGNVMVDPVTGKVAWSSPWTLNSVSPDGRYVLGISNVGPTSLYALLDASDGHLVAHIQPAGPRNFESMDTGVVGFAWDHDALLSDVYVGNQNAILRSDASGRTTVATRVVPHDDRLTLGVQPTTFYGLSGF
jgi:hypothetical protein